MARYVTNNRCDVEILCSCSNEFFRHLEGALQNLSAKAIKFNVPRTIVVTSVDESALTAYSGCPMSSVCPLVKIGSIVWCLFCRLRYAQQNTLY
jgi:hypothetical protein